ncbi:MAG: EamA family transporter [Planctomycetota bacterium]|nr:MAG: EamA family transporter [Planctomycetota bacterium]
MTESAEGAGKLVCPWLTKYGVIIMKYGIALTVALILNATANLLIKFGMKRFDSAGQAISQSITSALSALAGNWMLILGLFFFAINVLFYAYALKKIDVSAAYPVMVGGGFAIIALVAWKFLGESLSRLQLTGVLCILIGVWLVARDIKTDKVAHVGNQIKSISPTSGTNSA